MSDGFADVELGETNNNTNTNNAQSLLQQAHAKQRKRFSRIIFQVLMIEILYSYYLDFHLAFLILRALQLSNRVMGALVVLSNIPIFVSHILFPQQGALFIQFLHIQEEPFTILSYVLLLATDVLILIFQCIYLILKQDTTARRSIEADV